MLDDSFPYMMVEDYRSPNVLQDLKHAVLNGFPMIITVRTIMISKDNMCTNSNDMV